MRDTIATVAAVCALLLGGSWLATMQQSGNCMTPGVVMPAECAGHHPDGFDLAGERYIPVPCDRGVVFTRTPGDTGC